MTTSERLLLFGGIAVLIFLFVFRPRAPTTIGNAPSQDDSAVAPAYLSYNLPFSISPILSQPSPLVGETPLSFAGFNGGNGCGCG